jgi:hypothetical protein
LTSITPTLLTKPFDEKGKLIDPKKESKAKVKKETETNPAKSVELNKQLKLL